VFNYILLIFVVLYPSWMLCDEELSVCTYLILLVQEAKMNWEYMHAEGLRMHTGLKLVNHSKCSNLAVSALPDHTSSFVPSLFNKKTPVFCLGFAVCLLWLMLHRDFSFLCLRTKRWVDAL